MLGPEICLQTEEVSASLGRQRSGRWIEFPEVDRCEWFSPDEARRNLNPAQAEFIDRLETALA